MSESGRIKAEREAAAVTAGAHPPRGFLGLAPVVELEADARARLFRRNAIYVIAGAVLFATIYALLSWLKYRAFMDARFDLGNMTQAVYNTAHGHFLMTTTGDVHPVQVSRLGSHVDPILALFAIPWLVWPSPAMLLVLQSVIVATGAWPAYRLGVRFTRDPRAASLLTGAFLLYPALGFLVLNEFHPVALATPLLLWAFLYVEEDRWLWALPFLVLAAASKETVPLVLALMGAYFALRKRSWRPLILTVAALAYFGVAVWVVIPHYSGGQSVFIARYGVYGDSAGAVAKTALLHPGKTVHGLLRPSNIHYWFQLLWPFGFASLLSPLTLLISAPEALLNALSSVKFQRDIRFHYTAEEIAFIYAAAVLGLMRLWRWLGGGFREAEQAMRGQRVSRATLALLILLVALAANYFAGPLPFSLPGAANSGRDYAMRPHAAALNEAVRMIPPLATVSVNNNIGEKLSARPVVYTFPAIAGADWIALDTKHPSVLDKTNAGLYQLAFGKLVLNKDYLNVYAKDGVFVFRRVGAKQ